MTVELNGTPMERDDLELLLDSGTPEELQSFLNLLRRDEVIDLLEELPPSRWARVLDFLHASDIAELLYGLEQEQWGSIVEKLDSEKLSELLTEMEEPDVEVLLDIINIVDLPALFSEMESDDAADVLAELPEDQMQQILAEMPDEESEPLEQLMAYPEDSAGGLMQTELVRVSTSATVFEAIAEIRRQAEEDEDVDIHAVYVTDEKGRLAGDLDLDDLILALPETPIRELLVQDPELYWVTPEMDQEEVAHFFQRYDLVTLAVVDEERRLLGRITVDDIVDVLQEEASEDILRMAGASGKEVVYDRVFQSALVRLPWLVTNLLGGLITGYLMWLFKVTLKEIIALIAFVPVITGMGGNVGTQSSTITVRAFAIGRIDLDNIGRALLKEMQIGLLMGTICGLVVALIGWFWHGMIFLGIVVGVAMFVAMTVAATMGALFPAIFKRFNIDPAVASGPFVTTFNDVTGILIYFATATLFRSYLIGG